MDLITFVTTTSIGFIVVATPIILGLVEVFKRFVDNTKWAVLASLVFGAVIGFFFGSFGAVAYNILAGVLAGLSASGLYAGAKRLTN